MLFLFSLLGVHLQEKPWGSSEGCHSAAGEETRKTDGGQGFGIFIWWGIPEPGRSQSSGYSLG